MLLGTTVECADQCGQLVFFDVLKLVDEHYCGSTCLFGGTSNLREQSSEIPLEIAVVGQSRLRLEVEPDLDISELELEGAHEAGETTKSSLSDRFGLLSTAEAEQSNSKFGGNQCRQRAPLWRLEPHGCVPAASASERILSSNTVFPTPRPRAHCGEISKVSNFL